MKFEYIVNSGKEQIQQTIDAKDRIAADLIFSAKYPDVTPSTVIEHSTKKSTKKK